MLPYWLLFSICAAGALEHRRRPDRMREGGPLLIVAALFTMLMIGFRFQVGGDWINYVDIFDFIGYLYFDQLAVGSDPGYTLLNWLVQKTGFGIWAVNLFCSAVFIWGLTGFARKQPNPWLVLVVAVPYLVIVVAMGYTRQAVAMGLILACFDAFEKRRFIRFGIYILLAATFHKTAVIVPPLLALSTTRHRVFTGGMLLVLFVMLYYTFMDEAVDRMLNNYVENAYEAQGAGVRVAMNLPPAAIFLFFSKKFGLSPEQAKLWRIFSFAAFFALGMLILMPASAAVDRLALYLIPLQLFVLSRLPYAFANGNKPNGQLIFFVIAYSAVVQFVWLNFATHAKFWIPYKLYPWSGMEL